ncbi:CYTH and CHAD domain-containing protein [Goekera deserti]|uniref:CYTH and CHAD domain-containing protein n=1 Tax=Goekera deserti TaxID=2497753 RepID=A0A7K3WFN6_9ACTN|nr:CYTH and CHAD domain-containing protein [Goekera deserti]NDI49865.1 CHAD domain-containing protein [Goekera deserti]NEL55227.1 CYTH and CHAD domain-containing protein [Goekera deserti]
MASEHIEIERKFDVEEGYVLPDLSGVDGVHSVGEPVVHQLQASYHDTADLRLLRAKVTLRRRTGGPDAGWHVKLPAEAGARRELQSPLGRAVKTVPKAVLDPVLGIVRRAPTAVVATLSTRRLVTPLLAADGRVLAEVADDHVTGTAVSTGPGEAAVVTTWRELEVELVDGDEEVLAAVAAELVVSGARVSRSRAKVERVLADRLAGLDRPAVPSDDDADTAPVDMEAAPAPTDDDETAREADGAGSTSEAEGASPRGKAKGKAKTKDKGQGKAKDKGKAKGKAKGKGKAGSTGDDEPDQPQDAGAVVVAAVQQQLAALQRADLMVRTGQPDGVHQVRVAARRLRSILAAYRPVLQREHTDPVREELRWLGQELSGARDSEVSLAHLLQVVADQPAELVVGPVVEQLRAAEQAAEDTSAGGAGVAVLRQTRHLELLDRLFALVADPPLTEEAAGPAGPALAAVVAKTVKRLRRFVRAAEDAADDEARDLALHEVRKAAKRVRYTAEVAAGTLGSPVGGLVSVMKQLQEVLGDRQDTVVTREQCLRLGGEASAAGESAFTHGRLHALEEARSAAAEADFWALWPTLRPALRAATHLRP